jgi:hypothetical protein
MPSKDSSRRRKAKSQGEPLQEQPPSSPPARPPILPQPELTPEEKDELRRAYQQTLAEYRAIFSAQQQDKAP